MRLFSRPKPVEVEYHPTEWVLLTSGTTDLPKMIVHNLASLIGADRYCHESGDQSCVGHVLRHSPLRRAPDISPRRHGRRIAGALQRRRNHSGPSDAAQRARSNTSLRHALALAACPDEPGGPSDSAVLYSAVGRDRRPADPEHTAFFLPATRSISHAFASTEAGVGIRSQ